MSSLLSRLSLSAAITALGAVPAMAQESSIWWWFRPRPPVRPAEPLTPVAVPEIDASAGLLAIAAVLAMTAFFWERRRRRAR